LHSRARQIFGHVGTGDAGSTQNRDLLGHISDRAGQDLRLRDVGGLVKNSSTSAGLDVFATTDQHVLGRPRDAAIALGGPIVARSPVCIQAAPIASFVRFGSFQVKPFITQDNRVSAIHPAGPQQGTPSKGPTTLHSAVRLDAPQP